MDDKNRTEIKLAQSICTEVPTGVDIYQFGDGAAQHIKNTGIERAGGITNLYEQESTFTTAGVSTMIAKDGTTVQIDSSSNVRLNDVVIGNVGPYSVTSRGAIKGYSDAAWTASNTIIGIVKIGSAIRVDEINPATMAILNTRLTIFTMPSAVITNVVLVKYIGMNYSDSLQFVLSNNLIAYVLTELGTTIKQIGSLTWTMEAGVANTGQSVAWSPSLSLFCTVGFSGVATSPDGVTWTSRSITTGIGDQYAGFRR